MNKVYIDGKKIELPIVENRISIKDIKGMNLSFKPTYISFKNVIAECDKNTLSYIKKALKSLEKSIISSKGADRLAYITLYKKLLEKVTSYTVVKKELLNNIETENNEFDIEAFSKPEIHQIDEFETSFSDEVQTELEEQHFTTLKAGEESYIPIKEKDLVVDVEYKEVKPIKDNIETMSYKKDPSQDNIVVEEKMDLLQRLQQINSEGRIFTDESRITDSSLNINNAISLGKIKLDSLNVEPSKKQQVNLKNAKILEMGKVKFQVLKNACASFNKKISSLQQNIKDKSYKIKAGLICKYNQIYQINIKDCTIAEMSKKLSEKISIGSKNIAAKTIDKALLANQKIKDQLIKLKENLINEKTTNTSNEIEHAKVM